MNAVTPAPSSRPTRPGKQQSAVLKEALSNALKVDPQASVAIDKATNSATFLSGTFKVDVPQNAAKDGTDALAAKFLSSHGQLFGIAKPTDQLKLIDSSKDELGFEHFKYQQVYNGLPVFGQQVIVHAQDDVVKSVDGRLTPNVNIDATPKLKTDELMKSITGKIAPKLAKNEQLQQNANELGIYTTNDGKPHLAYQLDVDAQGAMDGERWRYYVDAQNGKVLDHWGLNETAINRETYDGKNGSSRPGKLARKEGDGPVADQHINKAHDNSGAVYDYFKENFNRDSIDDKGMKLTSTVHYGNKYNNAYWDGKQMTYGDGDGKMFTPFGDAADVVGHEMTHGVTERTAGLRYYAQSGALNESWSDVFGNLIERWDHQRKNPGAPDRDPGYLVGEDIFTPDTKGDALRSMSAPGTGYPGDPQPAKMKDYKNTSSDNGGVHINSGIPNKAAYNIAKTIGDDKLGKIWYRAQTKYLTSNSQFIDAANVTTQAAIDLYGATSPEVKAVRDGWTEVGLTPTVVPGQSIGKK